MTERHLYRVWLGWSDEGNGNRDEVLRILSNSYEEALAFVKKKMLEPDFVDSVDDWDRGFEWDTKPEECDCEDPEDHHCWTYHYVELDEFDIWTADDLTLNLLTPTLGSTNEFYDLTVT